VTDVDLGNALSLYAFGQYCQTWADWRVWIANKFAAERMWTWLKSADDWGWMRCGNSRTGGGPGSGNHHLAVFSGAAAFARMSRLTGDADKAREGSFLLARSAVAWSALPYYTDWARQTGQIGADEIVVGFSEGDEYLTASLLDDPMGATSLIGNNGIFPLACMSPGSTPRPIGRHPPGIRERFPGWVTANIPQASLCPAVSASVAGPIPEQLQGSSRRAGQKSRRLVDGASGGRGSLLRHQRSLSERLGPGDSGAGLDG
jgi:hypothetical protein